MANSGVYEVYNKTAFVERALLESAREGVTKACLDTEAIAKREITQQNAIDTGAARASIYSHTPEKNKYAMAIANAKSEASKGSRKLRKSKNAKPKVVHLFPDVEISKIASKPEGIVAVGALYGFYIEFGTARIPPRPFMTPAVETVGPAIEQFFIDKLHARLK